VVKPALDGGARFAHRGLASSPDTQAHALSLARTGDVIVQPYAVGIEAGEVSLCFFGGAYSHAVRKVPKPGEYRVQALHGGSEVPHVPTSTELEAAAAAMVQVPGRLTYARVDLLDHEGRPTLMELELIEPDLFLRVDGGALDRFCDAVEAELSSVTG
jgi:glutathione synthase/RimK-type ligase-like ATP-grasp enzyme